MKRSRPSQWKEEKLFFGGDDFFADLENGIQSAQKSIDLEMYHFGKGVVGDRISKALMAAAQRGVKVRILLDGIGTSDFPSTYEPEMIQAGIAVRYFRIFPWTLHGGVVGEPANWLLRLYFRLRRMNQGTHRKYVVIDESILWVATMNISDHHARTLSGNSTWKDLGVRVQGSDVELARKAFHRAFRRGITLRLNLKKSHLLLISQGYLQSIKIRNEQQRLLRRAQKRIWIQTPYFVPTHRVFRLMSKKAKKGLDVRIIVPEKNDIWFTQWMSYAYLFSLAQMGAKVCEYTPRFAHEKVYFIDDHISIGSTNLNHRSFIHDLEMDIVITHEENKKALVEDFIKCEKNSKSLNTEIYTYFPWWKRLFSRLFNLFSYWS